MLIVFFPNSTRITVRYGLSWCPPLTRPYTHTHTERERERHTLEKLYFLLLSGLSIAKLSPEGKALLARTEIPSELEERQKG